MNHERKYVHKINGAVVSGYIDIKAQKVFLDNGQTYDTYEIMRQYDVIVKNELKKLNIDIEDQRLINLNNYKPGLISIRCPKCKVVKKISKKLFNNKFVCEFCKYRDYGRFWGLV